MNDNLEQAKKKATDFFEKMNSLFSEFNVKLMGNYEAIEKFEKEKKSNQSA